MARQPTSAAPSGDEFPWGGFQALDCILPSVDGGVLLESVFDDLDTGEYEEHVVVGGQDECG
ncbi:unnamed protein product, partial [Amoebophrya sp. A25]|eukprot:GSA25T00012466001.1